MSNSDLIQKYAKGKESLLVKQYIINGPSNVRDELGLNEDEWRIIFDYLVFDHNLLYKTITSSGDFFGDLYVEKGMTRIRDILNILDPKYDTFAEVIFDWVAIVKGGLFKHVLEHRERYAEAIRTKGGDFTRKVLYLNKEKYQEHWLQILDLLLSTYCEGLIAEQNFDRGLIKFTQIMNNMRKHRKPFKSGLII